MSISETFRHWLLQPVIDFVRSELKKMEECIMAQTAKDVSDETAKLVAQFAQTNKDVLAGFQSLKDLIAAGASNEDLTAQVNELIALEKPLQDLDAAALAVTTPPPPPPPPPVV